MTEAAVGEMKARAFSGWCKTAGELELQQLLLWVWDPLGVSPEFPDAADQYDRYALEIATALASDATPDALVALLSSIEQNRMGLDPRPLESIVTRLRAWHQRSIERYRDRHSSAAVA